MFICRFDQTEEDRDDLLFETDERVKFGCSTVCTHSLVFFFAETECAGG